MNSGSFENLGEVAISNVNHQLLINYGVFTNQANGILLLENGLSYGIENYSSFQNHGTITLNRPSGNALQIQSGIYQNLGSGDLYINDALQSAISVTPGAGFYNADDATLLIDSTGTDGIIIEDKFENFGYISVAHAGGAGILIEADTLQNQGDIDVSHSTGYGLRNKYTGGRFVNLSGATFDINHSGNVSLFNENYAINHGSLTARNNTSSDGILNHNLLINYGSMIVENVFSNGFQNFDRFDNQGNISILNSRQAGFVSLGNFINELNAVMTIDSTTFSFGLYTNGKFHNKGLINIFRIDAANFRNHSVIDTLFNDGKISIRTDYSPGVASFYNYGYLINKHGGVIAIDSSNGEGWRNFGRVQNLGLIDINSGGSGVYSTDTIFNEGQFYIHSNPWALNIEFFNGMLENGKCGTFISNGRITVGAAKVVVNKGVFKYQNPNHFTWITGSFVNKGLFTDSYGGLIGDPAFTNSGHIQMPLYSNLSVGIKELPMFQVGNAPQFSIANTWWIDSLQNASAGTYTTSDLSFMPLASAIIVDTLWYRADPAGESCFHIVPIVKEPQGCSTPIDTATFTGNYTEDWHESPNWDTGRVPGPCTKVIIPSGLQAIVITGRKARAHSIVSDTGSILEVQNGVVMEVDPSN